jgi:hypothetical protein
LTVSLPYLLDLQLFFNLKIFTVTRLRFSFCSIRKAGSQANLKPNPINLLMDEPLALEGEERLIGNPSSGAALA